MTKVTEFCLLEITPVILTACFIGYCYHRYKLRKAQRQAVKAREVKCNFGVGPCSKAATRFYIFGLRGNETQDCSLNVCVEHANAIELRVFRSMPLYSLSKYPTIEERDLALVKKKL